MKNLQEKIQNIDSSNITEDDISAIESTIQELDNGSIRVADYQDGEWAINEWVRDCLLYTSPSPRDGLLSRMPSSA